MAKPTLYVFAISHYCEKARWALDHHGIDYALRHVMPGPHVQVARRLGAPASSVPYLVDGDQVIHDSANLVSWADQHSRREGASLTPARDAERCLEVERRLDEVSGPYVRRMYYSEALLDAPEKVRPIFASGLPLHQRFALRFGWGRICTAMIRLMDLGPRQRLDSRARIGTELDWLDGELGDGKTYLAGDAFTRADLAAASLLAPLVNPPQHPVYATLSLPPLFAQDMAAWADRPILRHVRRMYAAHRIAA